MCSSPARRVNTQQSHSDEILDTQGGVHRAHILAKKVSPRAFVEQPGKKGQATGEVGIEGTTIEAPDAVRCGRICKLAFWRLLKLSSRKSGMQEPLGSMLHVILLLCFRQDVLDQMRCR